MTTAIVGFGHSHDGGPGGDSLAGDAIICDGDRVAWIGDRSSVTASDHQVVIDAAGATLVPGLIDSHVHTTFGDYSPRQQAVGFIESYLHGGTTTCISASEVHVPGRPTDRSGVKALAVAAQRCFADYRPGGMRVYAGAIILEPHLKLEDFHEVREAGVWLAKAGFGAFKTAMDYVPVVHAAKEAGLHVMCHTGGGSIGGSQMKIGVDDLLAIQPHVSGHANGGPTALSSEENERLIVDGGSIAVQLAQAGNLRSAIELCELSLAHDQLDRILIATDTPTGTGVVPLGMLHLMSELASVGPLSASQVISAATGNVARAYWLAEGQIRVDAPADLVLLDAPVGSSAMTAFGAFELGDVPAVSCVVTAGRVRTTASRNTPPPKRPALMIS